MKSFFSLLFALTLLGSGPAHAEEKDLTCDDFQPNDRAREEYPNLIGACQDVVEQDGELYAVFKAMVLRTTGRNILLRISGTDRHVRVIAPPDLKIDMGGREINAFGLAHRDVLQIYLPVSEFAEPKIDELGFPGGDGKIVEVEAEMTQAKED